MIRRLSKFIDSLDISVRQFELSINASNGLIRKAIANQTDIQSKWITPITENYPQLNLDWLFTGKGEMLKSTIPAVLNHTTETTLSVEQTIPVFGWPKESLSSIFEKLQKPMEHLYIPNLPKVDGAVYMIGEAMRPALNGGDIAVYKTIKNGNRLENIFFGEMYLLSFEVEEDNDERITIKYIHPSDKENNVKLVSANNYYGPLDIPLSSITALAVIKASIRYNAMA